MNVSDPIPFSTESKIMEFSIKEEIAEDSDPNSVIPSPDAQSDFGIPVNKEISEAHERLHFEDVMLIVSVIPPKSNRGFE